MPTKLFWYDLETTGVDWWRHQPHQIAGIIEIDGEVKESFEIKMRPNPGAPVSAEALEVAGITIEDLKGYEKSQKQGYEQLCAILGKYVDKFDKKDKAHLCGYNNRGFDDLFLRQLWKGCGDVYFGSWFWADSIDVLVLASNDLKDERASLENFKLATVAKHYQIELDETKLHDAMYDVELTREIYKRFT